MDAFDPTIFGDVQKKLPLLGQAMAGAIEQIAGNPNAIVFCLFVIDTETQSMAYATNAERESLMAALTDWIHRQGH